ncbi:MAG TPA: hypothetical protein VHP36_03225 [Chitinispirillaceae bacterium]|nr:hypothetical protein [Chitinispirillaceae bacterium]
MNSINPKRHLYNRCLEFAIISIVTFSAIFLFVSKVHYYSNGFHTSANSSSLRNHLNVHDIYYSVHHDNLELRFPFRKRNDHHIYIRQVFVVFGGITLAMLLAMSALRLLKYIQYITSWDISVLCITLNLIFAYVFGFVAVLNDWWFFFPDLITGNIWQIRKAQMILGDALFYPMAVLMGHVGVIFVKSLKHKAKHTSFDILLKLLWFAVALAITIWGLRFGSTVMKVMIYFLYIPFCIIGFFLYRRYTGFELWSISWLFVLCEFFWDLVARVEGIWIFPDSSSHAGLYLNEIVFGHIGPYPLVWQPEMTQMAFSSGIICLIFFNLAQIVLGRTQVSRIDSSEEK